MNDNMYMYKNNFVIVPTEKHFVIFCICNLQIKWKIVLSAYKNKKKIFHKEFKI